MLLVDERSHGLVQIADGRFIPGNLGCQRPDAGFQLLEALAQFLDFALGRQDAAGLTRASLHDRIAAEDLAVARGDIDVAAGSYASKLPMLKSGDLIPILQYGKDKIADLPNVPMLSSLAGINDEGKQLINIAFALGEVGRPIVGPPGIPAARAKFLEIAMKKSLEDPELLALTSKQKMDVLYLSSEETSGMAKASVGLTAEQKKSHRTDIMAAKQVGGAPHVQSRAVTARKPRAEEVAHDRAANHHARAGRRSLQGAEEHQQLNVDRQSAPDRCDQKYR